MLLLGVDYSLGQAAFVKLKISLGLKHSLVRYKENDSNEINILERHTVEPYELQRDECLYDLDKKQL